MTTHFVPAKSLARKLERVHTPAVVDGELHHASASQVKTYQLCPRKWWFGKVGHAPDHSDTTARDLGTEVHAEVEGYLLTGVPTTHPIAREGLIHLPTPGPDILVEHAMVPPLVVAGVPWEGNIDVVVPPRPDRPLEAWVIDHKTTKNYRYCLTPTKLASDIQMLSYAHWVARTYWGPSSLRQGKHKVKVTHVYYHTRPAELGVGGLRSKRVDGWVHVADIAAQWVEVERTVSDMRRDAAKTDFTQVEPNKDACGAFGGCPFRARCNAMSKPPKSLSEFFSANRGPAASPPPVDSIGDPPFVPGGEGPTQSDGSMVASAGVAPVIDARLVLYINCIPAVGPHAGVARPLETVVEAYSRPILENFNAPDLRTIPFAEGFGHLARALRDSPPAGVYFASSRSAPTACAIETLLPLADVVVMGTGGQ